MKARIVKPQTMYYGEVYGEWETIFYQKWTGWHKVTPACFTKWGARIELEKYKKRNSVIEEFEL